MLFLEPHVAVLREQVESLSPAGEDYGDRVKHLAGFATHVWNFVKSNAADPRLDLNTEAGRALAGEWLGVYAQLSAVLAGIRRRAAAVPGLPEPLLDALAAAEEEVNDVLAVPLDKVVRAERQAATGKGRSIGEVRLELQRRLQA